jgi:Ni,Fe-hydrogenase I large subunit
MARLVIDPVTRVGGHLRVEAEVTGGQVQAAWSSGTMFRGIENVILGRDPRDAWMVAERICGTCTGVHALASVRAVERAFEIRIPENARLIRNILAATLAVRDHAVTFHVSQLPDWVDVEAALEADPAATSRLARSLSDWPSRPEHFVQVKDRVAASLASGTGGPWANGYWGHPAYRLSPEQDLLLVAHALDALDWQRYLMQLHALFGGRDPHPQSYLVGGMSLVPDWGGPESPGTHPLVPNRDAPNALSDQGLTRAEEIITTAKAFVTRCLPDTLNAGLPGMGLAGRGRRAVRVVRRVPGGRCRRAGAVPASRPGDRARDRRRGGDGPGRDRGDRRPCLVRGFDRRPDAAPSIRGRDEPRVRGPAAAVHVA